LLNFYANNGARLEANMNLATKVSEKWHTGVLAHHSRGDMAMDNNRDGFMDNPMFQQFNLINRWKYSGDLMESQIGVKALYENKTSGQTNFRHGAGKVHDMTMPYGANFKTTRLEGFTKTGFFLDSDEDGEVTKSLGIILNYTYQDQQSVWGVNTYSGSQNSLLLNAIYQSEITQGQNLRLGASVMSDEFRELYQENHNAQHLPNTHPTNYFSRKRREMATGLFTEYSYEGKKFSLIAGLRGDFHNLWGFFLTPRLHLKYDLAPKTFLRLSGGRGQRTANPLIENVSYLISSRKLYLPTAPLLEVGWNYGGSFSHLFWIGNTKATLTADFYRTDFEKQAIVDVFTSPQALLIYQLAGKSFANSLQVGIDYEIHEKLTMRLAYKYYDVRADFAGLGLRGLPFVPQNRLLMNWGYTTPDEKWEFDLTTEYFGRQVLPSTTGNPTEHQRPDRAPDYVLVNAQITRKLGKKWEVYLGGENIGNYRQQNPILDVNNPYGNFFDAGQVYAPVFGAMVYTGVRFTVE
jgi:outer membrane receptor for ferrienterochelin and colicins